jgi:hypothetical protein
MKKIIFLLFVCFTSFNLKAQTTDSIMLRKIFAEAMLHGQSYKNLEHLCKQIGGRLSGSPQAYEAVEYTHMLMKEMGADTAFKQLCLVPHWVRGKKEEGIIYRKGLSPMPVNVCALGGSDATPINGLKAPIIEITRWKQLDSMGKEGKIKGKIVFLNRPMDPTDPSAGSGYGHAVDQRWAGAFRAAKYGALAVLVRSSTHSHDMFPHTGVMHYEDTIQHIPAMSIATMDADILHYALSGNYDVEFFMEMDCKTLPEELSANVVGEIKGTEFPDEIITVGGHLDSWDLSEGAHDDGTGVMQSIEVLRIIKALGIKPKRTIRAVAFMNEENGGRGGKAYADDAKQSNKKFIAAFESDGGGFTPEGFSIDKIYSWQELFVPYHITKWNKGGNGGADVSQLKDLNTCLIELDVDGQRYFDYHHTANDKFENVNKRELEMGGAAMAMLVWLISEYGTE